MSERGQQRLVEYYDRRGEADVEWPIRTAGHRRAISALLGDSRFSCGIDAGCGTGRFLGLLREHCDEVIGFDISSGSLRAACRCQEGAALMLADVTHVPIASGLADLVLSINVLQHVGAYPAAFQELSRVLRPGGLLVANVLNPVSPFLPLAIRQSLAARHGNGLPASWPSPLAVRRALRRAGLRQERAVGFAGWPGASGLLDRLLIGLSPFLWRSPLAAFAPVRFLRARKYE